MSRSRTAALVALAVVALAAVAVALISWGVGASRSAAHERGVAGGPAGTFVALGDSVPAGPACRRGRRAGAPRSPSWCESPRRPPVAGTPT